MTVTITPEQRAAVRDRLSLTTTPRLAVGKGTTVAPCTITAIQLALTGELDDGPHPCVSEVIRRWVIEVQDAMPAAVRDSEAWREAAALIPGTAATPEVERARAQLIMDWMWDVLSLPPVVAAVPTEARPAWEAMCRERTPKAASRAAADASAITGAYAIAAAAATRAAVDATYASRAAADAAYAADAALAAADAAEAVTLTAIYGGAYAAGAAAGADVWKRADPAGLLARLCAVGEGES